MDSILLQLKTALTSLESGSLLSSFLALVLAYLGGIISSFTPCIYPMIPITVGFIGGSSERSVREGWILSSFYVLGMAAIYSVLGVIASISGHIFGTLTNTSGWYLFIANVMILSSLWMMDVIEFDLNVLISKFTRKQAPSQHAHEPRATAAGAFLLGASSGFIAAPCTTPVLTVILSFIATQKSILLGTLLMFSFALGLGTILVVIGTFTGAMKIMPKSGKWLKTVKILSGVLILALGEYFVFKAGRIR